MFQHPRASILCQTGWLVVYLQKCSGTKGSIDSDKSDALHAINKRGMGKSP